MKLQTTLQAFHIMRHCFGGMRRMPIDNQEYLARTPLHKVLQKKYERLRVELAIIGGGPKFASRIDRTDDIDALALAGGIDDGRVSLQPIGPGQRWIRLEASFIQKKDLGSQLFGPSFQPGT